MSRDWYYLSTVIICYGWVKGSSGYFCMRKPDYWFWWQRSLTLSWWAGEAITQKKEITLFNLKASFNSSKSAKSKIFCCCCQSRNIFQITLPYLQSIYFLLYPFLYNIVQRSPGNILQWKLLFLCVFPVACPSLM